MTLTYTDVQDWWKVLMKRVVGLQHSSCMYMAVAMAAARESQVIM